MTHDRTVDVKNVDQEAAVVASVQQNTSDDSSNPLPTIDTCAELITYPKLGTILSYIAPVVIEIATSPEDGKKKSSPFRLMETVALPDSCPACTAHSTDSGDTRRPGTTTWEPNRQNGPDDVEPALKRSPITVTMLLPCAAITAEAL